MPLSGFCQACGAFVDAYDIHNDCPEDPRSQTGATLKELREIKALLTTIAIALTAHADD